MAKATAVQDGSKFGGITKAERAIEPGKVYPALAQFGPDYSTVEDMVYGPTIKLVYLVYPKPDRKNPIQITELASYDNNLSGRYMKRVGVINGVTITEETDIQPLSETGWCLVELEHQKKNPEYLAIKTVTQAPDGFRWPDGSIQGQEQGEIPF